MHTLTKMLVTQNPFELDINEQMQFSDIRKKVVDLILLPQMTSKVKQFYRDQI